MRATRAAVTVGLVASLIVAGCSGAGGPILANPAAIHPPPPAPTATPARPADPVPIVLPRDDGPHDRLTEWWYVTGHLQAAEGDTTSAGDGRPGRYGFEYVIFRAERGDFPTSWASHLAITDEGGNRFGYAQRLEVGPGVDRSPRDPDGDPTGFDLAITGIDPSDPRTLGRSPWTMTGSGDRADLHAIAGPDEVTSTGPSGSLSLDLRLRATKPAALHDGGGWIDFGPAGGSYYYSRTAMTAAGALELGGRTLEVGGTAWFDHQWGDFISVGGGGWDWFAVNLADGTDLTLSLVRDADGSYPSVYGTLVDADGRTRHLGPDEFSVTVTDHWTSPTTGAVYPAAWTIAVPSQALSIELEPTVADQELDTRATTGVVYWEGSQRVTATRAGRPMDGQAYVELTGYAPSR